MPLASDFVVIQGTASAAHVPDALPGADDPGDEATPPHPVWRKTFDVGQRQPRGHAVVMLMIKGLTQPLSDLTVAINGQPIGTIYPYRDASPRHWFAQVINLPCRMLATGENVLALVSAGQAAPAAYADVAVRDVVCFFQADGNGAAPGGE